MRNVVIAAGMYLLLLCPVLMGQSSPASSSEQKSSSAAQAARDPNQPIPARRFRPELPLQNALKIAEAYIDREHIDISSYWLSQVRFFLYGSPETPDKDKIPCWHFWWMNDSAATGDYVEILVDMKGRASRVPSM
jgi:hypothetical protein